MSESLGQAIDAKDTCTKNHSDEVAIIAHTLALEMGLPPYQADIIHIAGHLHDIGKIGLPDYVLSKPGPLTREEWLLVKKHPAMGAAILSPVKAMAMMRVPELVLCHHERFDGGGYPRGLRGAGIPLGARILSVADSVSAMLQRRPYREAKDFGDVCREILNGSGTMFDPWVVEAFLAVRDTVHSLVLFTRESAEDCPPRCAATAALLESSLPLRHGDASL
jgi:HD-GYP domain-containing protein (c-di-GMP phosphodiesterase class II)